MNGRDAAALKSLGAAIAITLAVGFPACAQEHSWLQPELFSAAKTEGALIVYGSMNEQEALPLWKLFEDATGVKVNYVRSSDTQIMAKVAIENRAGQHTWDIALTTTVPQLPQAYLAPFDPPEAKGLMVQARDPNRRWYGGYANYNAPAYNTNVVHKADLPKTYEEFAAHKEWAGKIAIEQTDTQWVSALFAYYGEARARKLIGPMARGSVRRLKIGREMPHRLERILLRNPDQGIRIVNPKMSFHGIVEPWKAQDLYLAAPVVDAFYAEEIGVGHALLLAKLQPAQQEQALANCFREEWNGAGAKAKRILLPVRHLQQWIEHNVLLLLKQAPFNKRDPQLVPAAGSCVECSKRTGHNKLLFADVSGNSDACKLCGIWATASLSCWLFVDAQLA